jgi:hypothetical protein
MENISELFPLLTGPTSSVAICLLVGYASWKLVVDRVLPSYDSKFEKIMDAHDKDRTIFKDAVSALSNRIEKVEEDVNDIKKKVGA